MCRPGAARAGQPPLTVRLLPCRPSVSSHGRSPSTLTPSDQARPPMSRAASASTPGQPPHHGVDLSTSLASAFGDDTRLTDIAEGPPTSPRPVTHAVRASPDAVGAGKEVEADSASAAHSNGGCDGSQPSPPRPVTDAAGGGADLGAGGQPDIQPPSRLGQATHGPAAAPASADVDATTGAGENVGSACAGNGVQPLAAANADPGDGVPIEGMPSAGNTSTSIGSDPEPADA